MGLSRRAMTLRIALVVVIAMLAALPANAMGATTVSIATEFDLNTELEVQKLLVEGGPEANSITVALAGGSFTVSDSAAGVTAGQSCAPAGTTVVCPATDIDHTEINAGAGADTINASPIADTIDAGPGDDVIDSGQGGIDLDPNSPTYCLALPQGPNDDSRACGDTIDAGQGFDTVTFATRTSPIRTDMRPGRSGEDSDGAGEGINQTEKIIGGQDSDEIIGGIFNETLNGGPGNAPDTICGALGKDTIDYSDKTQPVTVTLDGVLATDADSVKDGPTSIGARVDCRPTIKSQDPNNGLPCQPNSHLQYPSCPAPGPNNELVRDCTADDGVAGENDCIGEDTENIIGSPQGDILIGNDTDPLYGDGPRVEPSGQNAFQGGGGNDLMDGGTGPDSYDGGAGGDAVSYEGRDEGVAASIDGAANDGGAADFFPASDQGDEILDSVEDLIGGNGGDVLKGDGADNILLGGPGIDVLQGHAGADDLSGDEGDDTLEGGEGDDLLDGGADNDTIHGGFGADTIAGGAGVDTADFSDATTPVNVSPNGIADDGRAGERDDVAGDVESLIGGIDDDSLVANGGDGRLQGNGGNDNLDGGLGADTFEGGAGRDAAAYGSHPGPVNVNLAVPGGDGLPDENDNVTADVENIGGSTFDDILSGNGDVNYINGGRGNDRISGAEGDDFLAGDLGNDTLNGDVGADILDGAEGDDTLNGTAGNDTLRGFTGVDVLDGGTGSDTISGGSGVDVVSYASRSGDVTVDTLGDPDDGERGENDLVQTDVESVRTGSGDDVIDIGDGAAGAATCGAGTDEVTADPVDTIGEGCEAERVKQAGICVPTARTVRVSRSGQVSLRMTCAFAAKGTVQLRSASRVKTGKGKARRINLGKKSFTGKIGRVTVKMRISKSGRSVIKRKKRLSVMASLRVRRDAANAATRLNVSRLTLRASGK